RIAQAGMTGGRGWRTGSDPQGLTPIGGPMNQTLRRVAVIGGVRIPFCRSNTLYAAKSNLEVMTAVLKGLADTSRLAGVHSDEAAGAAVASPSKDWNLAR